MKILKKLLFMSALVFCFSMAASAQNTTPTPVPKPSPPVINVGDKKPKDEKPKNDDKKKPDSATLDLPRKFKLESV